MDSRRPKQARLTDFFCHNNSRQRLSSEDLRNRSLSAQTEEQSRSEESTAMSTEVTDFDADVDIGKYLETAINDELKYKILTEHWNPPMGFIFPNIARAGSQTRYLRFQSTWLVKNKWLVYSRTKQGGFCKYCPLFATLD